MEVLNEYIFNIRIVKFLSVANFIPILGQAPKPAKNSAFWPRIRLLEFFSKKGCFSSKKESM